MKCDEARPTCGACRKKGIACDYKVKLNWLGSVAQVRAPAEVTRYKRRTKLPPTPESPHIFTPDFSVCRTPITFVESPHPRLATKLDPTPEMKFREHFEFFINVTGVNLVPVPYAENPFTNVLPKLALGDDNLYDLLVAYGAAHRDMLLRNGNQSEELVNSLVDKVKQALDVMQVVNPDSDGALTLAAVLSSLDVDRNRPSWRYYAQLVLEMLDRNPRDLSGSHGELQSFVMRLTAFMEVMGSLSANTFSQLPAVSWWPRWSGSFDYLTGVDLNVLPLFAEVANLVQQREYCALSLHDLAGLYRRGLQIFQLLGDYWFEEYRPVNEISAMCLLFQQALQVHIYRRLFTFKLEHEYVQRLVARMTRMFDQYIKEDSTIQCNMAFIIVTAASEALDPEMRKTYLRRLKTMERAGFAYASSVSSAIVECWNQNQSYIGSTRLSLLM